MTATILCLPSLCSTSVWSQISFTTQTGLAQSELNQPCLYCVSNVQRI